MSAAASISRSSSTVSVNGAEDSESYAAAAATATKVDKMATDEMREKKSKARNRASQLLSRIVSGATGFTGVTSTNPHSQPGRDAKKVSDSSVKEATKAEKAAQKSKGNSVEKWGKASEVWKTACAKLELTKIAWDAATAKIADDIAALKTELEDNQTDGKVCEPLHKQVKTQNGKRENAIKESQAATAQLKDAQNKVAVMDNKISAAKTAAKPQEEEEEEEEEAAMSGNDPIGYSETEDSNEGSEDAAAAAVSDAAAAAVSDAAAAAVTDAAAAAVSDADAAPAAAAAAAVPVDAVDEAVGTVARQARAGATEICRGVRRVVPLDILGVSGAFVMALGAVAGAERHRDRADR
ncbi:MAG: hypothetical protein KR126chlam2_00695, partial [Chlamydiae bacterium]|nr:hypothetical protein [Chlamydiota bacterium]